MPPKSKRTFFSQNDIESQLQQLYLFQPLVPSTSSSSYNSANTSSSNTGSGSSTAFSSELLELAPIIRNIHASKQQDAFLKGLEKFVDEKDGEIEAVCKGNYQEFISSVEKLLKVRSGTVHLKRRAMELNDEIQKSGEGVASKRRELLEARKVAQNLDETIDTLQACLRVLDLSSKIGRLIEARKYFAALKAIESLSRSHLTSQFQLPPTFTSHMLSTLPSSRTAIKDAVTREMKTWLFEVREVEGEVGKRLFEGIEVRQKRWKSRIAKEMEREREEYLVAKKKGKGVVSGNGEAGEGEKGSAAWEGWATSMGGTSGRGMKVGCALELTWSERHEYDVIDSKQVEIDFRPLLQCIHIYDALDAREELQLSYQSDRRAQASLILSQSSPTSPPAPSSSTLISPPPPGSGNNQSNFSLASLTTLLEQIVGFFVIESHVIRQTSYPVPFRSESEVDDLWEGMCERVVEVVGEGLKGCEDPEVFLGVKGLMGLFLSTLEGYGYSVSQLNSLLLTLLERYGDLLHKYFRSSFTKIVAEEDFQPLQVANVEEFQMVLKEAWFPRGGEWGVEALKELAASTEYFRFPFTGTFVSCCQQLRKFVEEYYHFAEGLSTHTKDIDDILRKALDHLLIDRVSNEIDKRASSAVSKLTLAQLSQIITNVLFFEVGCEELERLLSSLKTSQRGGAVRLEALASFNRTLDHARLYILQSICEKIDNLDHPRYDWVSTRAPTTEEPSDDLKSIISYLGATVDSNFDVLGNQGGVKEWVYRGALEHIASTLMLHLTEKDPPKISHHGLARFATDVRFLVQHASELGYEGAAATQDIEELSQTVDLLTSPNMLEYLDATFRSSFWPAVHHRKLQNALVKLVTWQNSVKAAVLEEGGGGGGVKQTTEELLRGVAVLR